MAGFTCELQMNLVANAGETTSWVPPLVTQVLIGNSVFILRDSTFAHTFSSTMFLLFLFFQLPHPSDVQLVSRFLLDGSYFGNFFLND